MNEQNKANLCAGWRMARVGDILKVRNGYAFKSSDYKSEGVPLIRQSNLGDDIVEISKVKRVATRFLTELPGFIVRDGDLLIGMSGSLGKIARYQYSEPALQNQRTGLLVVRPDADARFAKMVLKYVEPQILAEGKGVAVQNVSAKEIEDCRFPLPPLDEQRRIAAEIEKQFTRLEAGVAALKRVQANLKRYRAAILKAACDGKLVPTEADLARKEGRTYETGDQLLAHILTERRRKWQGRGKYKEPIAPDTANLQPLPEGWTWATLDQLSSLITKGSSPNWQGFSYCEKGVAFVRSENVRWGRLDLSSIAHLPSTFNEKENKSILRKGDVLLNIVGASIGRAAIATHEVEGGNVNQAVAIIRLVVEETMNHFAVFWLISSSGQKHVHSKKVDVARANFSLEDTRGMPLPLPPLAEQERIFAEVERQLSVVEEQEAVVSANLQRAIRLRQSILRRAFTGHLSP